MKTVLMLIGGGVFLIVVNVMLPKIANDPFDGRPVRRAERRVLFNEIVQSYYIWILAVCLVPLSVLVLRLLPDELNTFFLERVAEHPLGAVGLASGGFLFGLGMGFSLLNFSPAFRETANLPTKRIFKRQYAWLMQLFVLLTLAFVVLSLAIDSRGTRAMWATVLSACIGVGAALCVRYRKTRRSRKKKLNPWGGD